MHTPSVRSSFADPDPNGFGSPGSGSVSTRYGFRILFYHHDSRTVLTPTAASNLSQTLGTVFAAKSLAGNFKCGAWVFRCVLSVFLGLTDPDPLVTSADPDPSIIKKNSTKNLNFYCFVTSL